MNAETGPLTSKQFLVTDSLYRKFKNPNEPTSYNNLSLNPSPLIGQKLPPLKISTFQPLSAKLK